MITIAISGGRASFSEDAVENYIRKNDFKDVRIDYLVSIERVLSFLEVGKADLGIFPVTNSSSGVVEEALHAMAHHVFTVKEVFNIPVHLFLMGLPGISRDKIATIVSHPHIFKECEEYLKTQFPNVKLKEHPDTAKAAQELKSKMLSEGVAVIASRAAADLYDLEIIEENIQDQKNNYTTFVVVGKYE